MEIYKNFNLITYNNVMPLGDISVSVFTFIHSNSNAFSAAVNFIAAEKCKSYLFMNVLLIRAIFINVFLMQ